MVDWPIVFKAMIWSTMAEELYTGIYGETNLILTPFLYKIIKLCILVAIKQFVNLHQKHLCPVIIY